MLPTWTCYQYFISKTSKLHACFEKRSLGRAAALSLSGPNAPCVVAQCSLCQGPALFVGVFVGTQRSSLDALCVEPRRSLCWGTALLCRFASGPDGPNAVEARRSSPQRCRVGVRRFLRRSPASGLLCWSPPSALCPCGLCVKPAVFVGPGAEPMILPIFSMVLHRGRTAFFGEILKG